MAIYMELSSADGFVDPDELSAFVSAVQAAENYEGTTKIELMLNGLRADLQKKVK